VIPPLPEKHKNRERVRHTRREENALLILSLPLLLVLLM